MTISEIRLGSLLEIYIKRDGYNYKVISKIEYVDEEKIGVTPIASRTKLFRFRDGDVVDIVYRLDDKSWKWANVRAGVATMEDGTKLHVFIPVREAEIFNRRTTYRLPMNREIELTYEVVDERVLLSLPEERKKTKTPELDLDATLNEINTIFLEYTVKAYLLDMSEGGASVSMDVELKKGDIVSFSLPFGEQQVVCRALVVRTAQTEKGPRKHNYGLSFIETSNNYVAYFFTEQRKMLSESKTDYTF